jgi:transcriptional pleiotropic regulator of transition state genes
VRFEYLGQYETEGSRPFENRSFKISVESIRGNNMKSTGVVRKVDELGRVVLPIEIRRIFDMKHKDPIEIFTENDTIILRKYQPQKQCAITGTVSDENMTFSGGIVLSPEGCERLVSELIELGRR